MRRWLRRSPSVCAREPRLHDAAAHQPLRHRHSRAAAARRDRALPPGRRVGGLARRGLRPRLARVGRAPHGAERARAVPPRGRDRARDLVQRHCRIVGCAPLLDRPACAAAASKPRASGSTSTTTCGRCATTTRFLELYGESAAGRKAPTRFTLPPPATRDRLTVVVSVDRHRSPRARQQRRLLGAARGSLGGAARRSGARDARVPPAGRPRRADRARRGRDALWLVAGGEVRAAARPPRPRRRRSASASVVRADPAQSGSTNRPPATSPTPFTSSFSPTSHGQASTSSASAGTPARSPRSWSGWIASDVRRGRACSSVGDEHAQAFRGRGRSCRRPAQDAADPPATAALTMREPARSRDLLRTRLSAI